MITLRYTVLTIIYVKVRQMFVEDLTKFMDGLSMSSSSPLNMGDFSYHVVTY